MHELAAPLLDVIRTDCGTFSGLRASLGQGSGDPGQSKALAELVATIPPELLCWGCAVTGKNIRMGEVSQLLQTFI